MARKTSRQKTVDKCAVFLPMLLLVAIGCDGTGVVKINAKVTLDGEPLPRATVNFFRAGEEKGRAAFGSTDEEGNVRLTTYEPHDGVLPGNYSVIVLKAPENPRTFKDLEIGNDPEALVKMSSMHGMVDNRRRTRVRTTLPEIYSKIDQTPLKCNVTKEGEEFVFELRSDFGK